MTIKEKILKEANGIKEYKPREGYGIAFEYNSLFEANNGNYFVDSTSEPENWLNNVYNSKQYWFKDVEEICVTSTGKFFLCFLDREGNKYWNYNGYANNKLQELIPELNYYNLINV